MEKMAIGIMLGVGDDPMESIQKVLDVGVDNAQMGRPPDEYLSGAKFEELKEAIEKSGITITTVFCGYDGESYADIPTVQRTVGLVNRDTRAERLKKTFEIANFAENLGVKRIAAHIGFVPEDTSSKLYQEVVETIRQIADYCKPKGMVFALETGQEAAAALLQFIKDVDRDNIRVNFDPANMILYGSGDPIPALELLAEYVDGVHCKDGKGPTKEGELGTEYPLGEGDVGIDKFIATLKKIGYEGPLTIEREITGEEQKKDIIEAIELLKKLRS
jgi:sugar phosphate isomerase/epimerase